MASLISSIKQIYNRGVRKYLNPTTTPIKIVCTPGTPSQIIFKDGKTCKSSCLGCYERPCMKLTSEYFTLINSSITYPIDNDNSVCPIGAIHWDEDNNCPQIDHAKCIKCGLCVSRCPVKAIYISKTVSVEKAPNDCLIPSSDANDDEKIEHTIETLSKLPTSGCLYNESDSSLNEVYSRISEQLKNADQQFPNRFARNLLIALGCKAFMRRNGEVYSRTDLIFEAGNKLGVCEVEFSDLLDTPRDILDDMAVCIARYNNEKCNIVPLVVGFSLPNGRSEFWEVIYDIQKVLGIKIATMTIGALLLLLWNQKNINFTSEQFPYADCENCSIRPGVNLLLGHPVALSFAYRNILEPVKNSR